MCRPARFAGLLVLGLATLGGFAAEAAIRTRVLPELHGTVEAELAQRAAAAPERLHAIVQVAREQRDAAVRSGVRLLDPLDGDLWLASVPSDPLRQGAIPPGVQAAWDLRPRDRVAPGLVARLAAGGTSRAALRVKIFRDVSFEAARVAIVDTGARVTSALPKLRVLDVDVPLSALSSILACDEVRWVELAPRTPQFENDGLRVDAHVNEAQALGLHGDGVVIGQWDDDVADFTHPDLAGRGTAGQSGLFPTVHATHVAGIAIGDGTNSVAHGGSALEWRGVATEAQIVGYGVLDALAETDSALVTFGIDVSTNSWTWTVDGTNCFYYGDYAGDAPEYDAIVRGALGAKLPVVFAAGNERDDADCAASVPGGYGSLPPPGTAKNVICVGAHHSDIHIMTPFSSWGPTDDGRMKPDVSAPGCQGSVDFGITSTFPGGSYAPMCGTSMATPAVSGSIALLIQDWRALFPGDPRPATHKALLGGFAQDRGPAGPDYRFGLGAIDVQASVQALRTATTIQDQVSDLVTAVWSFRVAPGTDTLRVTLVWDDPPAAELADTTLVNDLDLQLIGPSSGSHLPFILNPEAPSAVATVGVNRLDNVEQVRVISPEAGAWIAFVKGTNVPVGPQEYSLVGFDRRPPAGVAALVASGVNDTTVVVTWIRPGDVDRAGTLVVRSSAAIVWTPATGATYSPGSQVSPGVFVVASDDVDHSTTPLADQPLAPGTIWHYALFAHDEIPNYAPGVADTAKTSADAVGIAELPSAARVRFARVGRNPTAEGATFRLELPRRAAVEIAVFDTLGRRVAVLTRGERDAGSHVVAWDGRDERGASTSAGVYFVRLTSAELTATEKVVRVP